MHKKSIILNLNEEEFNALEYLADKKGMNKSIILRQALRLYQTIQLRLEKGEKVFVEDNKNEKSELLFL